MARERKDASIWDAVYLIFIGLNFEMKHLLNLRLTRKRIDHFESEISLPASVCLLKWP